MSPSVRPMPVLLALALAACGQDAENPAQSPPAQAEALPFQPSDVDDEPPPPSTSEEGSILQEVFSIAEARREGEDAAAGYQDARERMQQALEEHPDDPKLHAAMGHLWADEINWRHLGGEEAQEHGAQAEAAYRRALDLDPDHVRANAGLGDLQLNLETTAGAQASVTFYERALAADPQDGHSRQRLVEALTNLGREDEAAALLAEAPTAPTIRIELPGPEETTEEPFGITTPPEPGQPEATGVVEPNVEPPTDAEDAQLEAWKKLAEREVGNAAVQRAVAIQCRQRGDERCAHEYEARADALEGKATPEEQAP